MFFFCLFEKGGDVHKIINEKGCLVAGEEWLERNLLVVAGIAVGVAFLQVCPPPPSIDRTSAVKNKNCIKNEVGGWCHFPILLLPVSIGFCAVPVFIYKRFKLSYFYLRLIGTVPVTSVADPDPVGSGPFWSDPDPDVWDRIRFRALINYSVSTFLVCIKAINT
jgi:hypothetical protein